MTGSSYIPIVVPIIAFVAMAFWLGLLFHADSHPGYKHRKPQPVPDIFETDGTTGGAAGPESGARPETRGPAGPGEHERIDEHASGALLG